MLDDAKAVKAEIDGELSSSTQENAAVSGTLCHLDFKQNIPVPPKAGNN